MKTKYLLLTVLLIIVTALQTMAQDATNGKPEQQSSVPYVKKLPRLQSKKQSFKNSVSTSILNNQFYFNLKQVNENRINCDKRNLTALYNWYQECYSNDFHLVKDINPATPPSNPSNGTTAFSNPSLAVLDGISYFAADDGFHGAELWRTDGTYLGTYMVKDIATGSAASSPYSIIVAHHKLYFSAYTDATGWALWVSDGTTNGTHLLYDVGNIKHQYAEVLVKVNNTIFFTTNSDFGSAVWETDGTAAGTLLLYDFNAADLYSGYVTEPVAVNGLFFFSAWNPEYGRSLWKSDGTIAGTGLVKDFVASDETDHYSPLQLTEYHNKLYFAGDDGSGRKLWYSDGTTAGTLPVSNSSNVFIDANYLNYGINNPFVVVNNELFFSGYTITDGSGLYKLNDNGIHLVKDFSSGSNIDYATSTDLAAVGDRLFFKVISDVNGFHDELWTSGGKSSNTQPVKIFTPGHVTTNYYSIYSDLFFVETDSASGAEPWTSNGTEQGTHAIKDVYKGTQGSYPFFFTPFRGKVLFTAIGAITNKELWLTDGTEQATLLVKDINHSSTASSYAGSYWYGPSSDNMTSLGDEVIFNAYENIHGAELYKSDGTEQETYLLNDIKPGNVGSGPMQFLTKKKVVYFSTQSDDMLNAIYKTNGTREGLTKITPDYNTSSYYIDNYNIANNGVVFYILSNQNTYYYELWRSDGTTTGTFRLSANLSYAALQVINNTAFFIASDGTHGYELWKSDGTVARTKMVKDINPGINDAFVGGLLVYKNEVYFGAYNGNVYGFWKSDGTNTGTVKLKNIYPSFEIDPGFASRYYCISNGILYFSAINYNNSNGTELWKTDGTSRGTQVVKDIAPNGDSYNVPYYLTDVCGTVFFIGDDGIHGTELWKTDGTKQGTQLIKDITPSAYGSVLNNLVSYTGKLYFTSSDSLWLSDGTENGTTPVNDPVISKVQVYNIVATRDKLFLSAYTSKYGTELYAGKLDERRNFTAAKAENLNTANTLLNVLLFPNPAKDVLNVKINSSNNSIASLSVTDAAGKMVLNENINSIKGEINIQLNVSHLSSGTYFIKIISADGTEKSAGKFIKE